MTHKSIYSITDILKWHQIGIRLAVQTTLHQHDIQKANNVNLMMTKPNLKNNRASLNITVTKIIKINKVIRLKKKYTCT